MTFRAESDTHPLCLLFSTQAYLCHVKPWSCVTWSEVFRVMAFKLVTVEMSFYFSCSSASQVVILSVWNTQKTHYQLLNAICNVWYSFTIYSSTQFMHCLINLAHRLRFAKLQMLISSVLTANSVFVKKPFGTMRKHWDKHHGACYLLWKSKFGARNDVAVRLKMFHLQAGKTEMDACIVVFSIVRPYPYVTEHYVIVCAWKHKNNISTDRRCTILSVWVFNDTKSRPRGH